MAEPDWMLRHLNGFHSGTETDVGEVNNHTKAVHFLHQVNTKLAESNVLTFVTTRPDVVEIVVGDLDYAHSEPVIDFHKIQIVFDGSRVLETENDANAIVLFSSVNIRDASYGLDPLCVTFKIPAKTSDVLQRLFASFPNRDAGVDRSKTSFMQVPINLCVSPSTDIQAVNDGCSAV